VPGVEPIASSFLIDGGANSYMDIYKPFSDAHHLPPAAMKLLDDPGSSAGGTTQSRDGRAERIMIGPFSIRNPPITFSQGTVGLMAAKDHAGLVGAQFLDASLWHSTIAANVYGYSKPQLPRFREV